MASSKAKRPIQLLDLHPDILIKIFREYVPLQDKLHTLLKMPEFRDLLKHRSCYLSSAAPFSFHYIHFLRSIRPGWYMARSNWSHRFFLEIEETTLHISLRHFLLEGFEDQYKPNSRYTSAQGSLDRMQRNFDDFLRDYQYMEDLDMLTYHLKNYGFIMIDFASHSILKKMRFYNWREGTLVLNRKQQVYDSLFNHFFVTLTSEKKLIVECRYGALICPCEERVQELHPFRFGFTKDCTALTWNENEKIPLITHQNFALAQDARSVKATMIYHVSHPFYDTLQVDVAAKNNEHLKKLLIVEDKKSPAEK